MANLKKVTIYTDGACSGNPGIGGWGAILTWNGHEKEISGSVDETTNNRMELTAAIEALSILRQRCLVDLYTDSVYLRDGITKWLYSWQKNNWRKADKKPVKNAELWQSLAALTQQHEITWHWVKGHADNEMNIRADKLATNAIKQRNALKT